VLLDSNAIIYWNSRNFYQWTMIHLYIFLFLIVILMQLRWILNLFQRDTSGYIMWYSILVQLLIPIRKPYVILKLLIFYTLQTRYVVKKRWSLLYLTIQIKTARFEVFTAMKIKVAVFWVVTTCNDVVGYQSFGWLCSLHFQGREMKIKSCTMSLLLKSTTYSLSPIQVKVKLSLCFF
jgi:hypothetical protein